MRCEVEEQRALDNQYRGRVKFMLNLDELEGYAPISQIFLRPHAAFSPKIGLLALQRLRRPFLQEHPQTIGEHLRPKKVLSEEARNHLLGGGNTKTTVDLFRAYRQGPGAVEPFEASAWAWSYLKVSYKVFIERFFRGDLDIVEGLLFVPFKPAFESRKGRGLDFLKLFLAEYVRSETFLGELGPRPETPAGVPDLEVADEAEAQLFEDLKGPKKRFLSNPYFFNKTFLFFCCFWDLFTTKQRDFWGLDDGQAMDPEAYQRWLDSILPYQRPGRYLWAEEEGNPGNFVFNYETFEACEVDKLFFNKIYPLPLQIDVVDLPFKDIYEKRRPLQEYFLQIYYGEQTRELEAAFHKKNKDFFFKKTYINKFNAYFFRRGKKLTSLKALTAAMSTFLHGTVERDIAPEFRSRNIFFFFSFIFETISRVNINVVLNWILDFTGFIFFFRTKAVPKFLKKQTKKKYAVEPFLVRREVRSKYTLKYLYYFIEKEEFAKLEARAHNTICSVAYEYQDSKFFEYKLVALKKIVYQFLKK